MSTSSDIARVKALLRSRSDKLIQALFLEADRRVVLRTPVDTGRARGNWMVSEGQPSDATRPDHYDKSGAAVIAEGIAQAQELRFGDVGYIVNNLPYIDPLENGHSKQAPSGMVAVTVEELRQISDRIVSEIERGR